MKKIYLFIILVFVTWMTNAQSPVAKFTVSDNDFCAGTCVNFTDQSTNNPTHWLWSFQGAVPSSSSVQNPQNICYNSSGNYDVKLLVSNSSGSDSITKSGYVIVNPLPPTPVVTCLNDTVYTSTDTAYVAYQWKENGNLIPGATDTFYVVSSGGSYTVIVVNQYGCQATASGICGVGIATFSENNDVTVYPNPVSDKLVVNKPADYGTATVSIMNVLGQEAIPQWKENNTEIDVGMLPAGIYFVQVSGESGRWVGRFVKE